MELPKQFDNINSRLIDDIKVTLKEGSKVSIAAASFSIYAYEALKNELEGVEELRFIFTSPTFNKPETGKKEKREFYIPKLNRERNLYGSEYSTLSESERNQRALDNYLKRHHSKCHIVKMYERYIGYLYKIEGYDVNYRGVELGKKDGGIDLICRKGGEILLVQCKNWSQDSTIYEKHICQLYGASRFFDKDTIQKEYNEGLFANVNWERVSPIFVTTTQLDEHALDVAKKLDVKVRNISFKKLYPIIKCNINNGDMIYHLPIDQMYDRTKICKKGECYLTTVQEAENKGFRRAHRWKGN